MLLETENHTIKHHSPLTTRTRQLSDTKSQDYGETINLPPVRVEKDKSLSESSEIVKTTDSSLLENQEIKEDSESLNTLSASMQTIVETTTSQLEKSEQSANSTDELNTIVLHTQKPEPRPRKSKQSVAKNLISNESESLIQSMHENAIVSNEEFKGMENYSTNASISTDKFLTTREQKHIAESLQVTPASTLESSRHERKYSRPTTVPSTAANLNSAAREQRRQRASHTQDIKYVNILLLGTSGVGKSTFINALVNYHAFETLQEARSNSPHVVMPVSFPLSVGDQFEEHMVTFGDDDANEDHHHPGQSVTQHCRSYLFPIDSRTKLRIIDTPGMNDTRGIDQDDLNMQHILSFINNLSHLNAICILLKPNESRLNIILRSYFTHLFSFIGENVYKNVVFCFTHTRSTFFAPGNTAPLLREMINKLPMNGVRFLKSNTFCFDSESFRYLIALNNGIEFDAFEREEYEKSWLPSTTESKRFIHYICEDLEPIMEEKWQSIEHVQFKINEIIRPLLETVRNCIRNIILFQEESYDMFIKLSSFAVQYSSAICYQCERTPKQFNGVLILPDDIHILTDKCNDCGCSKNKHGEIKYTLDYQSIQKPPKEFVNELQKTIKQLTESLLEFAQIYASTNENVQNNDPVVSALKRMINEESQLCSYEENQNDINSKLHQVLNDLLEKYKNKRSVYKSNKISIDLSSIYSHIRESSAMKEVAEQLGAIKQAQDIYMKEHEKQVL
ncbi:hypothetical protein I4U23_020121 [Adineta vaga]|nr:hypothetical protein I4U23_020121 [Adineta vaga]